MSDRNVSGRRTMPESASSGSRGMPIAAMLQMVKANNLPGLKREISQGSYTQDDLHSLLFQACYKDRHSVVDMLVDHPSYTTDVLARIVVDALDRMQAEFAFHLLGHDAFRERALNAALHEAAGRKDEGDLEAQITALIKAGADTGSRNEAGCTALEIARSAGYVSDNLAGLLQPEVEPPITGSSTPFKYEPFPFELPLEVMSLCLDNISVSDRKTIGAASGACQRFYLFLMDKRKHAQSVYRSENLESIPIHQRAAQYHELIRSLEKETTSSASGQRFEHKALILCNLILQIRNLKKADREAAYEAALKACVAMPHEKSLLPELARTLDCLPSGKRDAASKAILKEARMLTCTDDVMHLLTLNCRAVQICCMHNTMDLEPRFKALALDCIALPEASRLDTVLHLIRMIAANDDELVQGKALRSLMSIVESLPTADKAKALLNFAGHFSGFPRIDFPWIGIFRWFLKQAGTLTQAAHCELCHCLCNKVDLTQPDVRSDIFEKLAKRARKFALEDRINLLRNLSNQIACVPESHEMRENWFKWMVAESTTLLPEHQRQLLVDLCCRLDELDHKPRVDAYMLIISKMPGLPPPEQYNLMNGRGLLGKISYLSKDARLAVFKSLADVVGTMPDAQRKPIARYMTGDECLRLMPATPERDKICAALADMLKSVRD